MMKERELPLSRKVLIDVLAGVGDVLILEKHQISPSELLRIKKAVERHQIQKDLPQRSRPSDKRKVMRNSLLYRIPIQDSAKPFQVGLLIDISGRGIQTLGIQAEVGEEKNFVVSSGRFNAHDDFFFRAKCQWAKSRKSGERVAGFTITHASREAANQLTKLMAQLTL
jgi:hypothetical protein